jgi:hypothetical protein
MTKTDKDFNSLNVRGSARLESINLEKGAVTQATSISTAVTLNKSAGIITAVSSTLGTNGNANFTVNNSSVMADSVVLCNIVNYSGSQGAPFSRVQNVTQGSFGVSLRNVDDINALNGIVKFAFSVL